MRLSSGEKLAAGLRKRGVELHGLTWQIIREPGQGMMNKAAGEIGPTWVLRCDALFHGRRAVDIGSAPTVSFDGHSVNECEVCSHMPLLWILKHPPEKWQIYWNPDYRNQLRVEAPSLPPTW